MLAPLTRLFAIDLRTLALFRACLALVWLADTLARLGDARAFYTDGGLLPRWFATQVAETGRLSLHFANGETWFVVLALLAQALVGLALLAGWRARRAATLGWVIGASLANRNPVVLVDADLLLIALLFWSQFLPISARWSVDAALSLNPAPRASRHLSWASAALTLQVAGVAAILLRAAWSQAGSGIPGDWGLGPSPAVLLTASTVFLGGWFWDWRARRLARAAAAGKLRIYHDRDCAICLTGCLLLREFLILPGAEVLAAQDHARARALREANDSWVVIDYDDKASLRWAAFATLLRRSPLLGWLGWIAVAPGWRASGDRFYEFVARHRGALARDAAFVGRREVAFEAEAGAQRVAAIVAGLVLAWNLAIAGALPGPVLEGLGVPLRLPRLDQDWWPAPDSGARQSSWLVIPARLANGAGVDLLDPRRDAPSYVRPSPGADERGFRWRVYERHLLDTSHADYRRDYARYLCERWNRGRAAADPERLRELRLVEMIAAPAALASTPVVEQRVLWRQDCAPAGSPPEGWKG